MGLILYLFMVDQTKIIHEGRCHLKLKPHNNNLQFDLHLLFQQTSETS